MRLPHSWVRLEAADDVERGAMRLAGNTRAAVAALFAVALVAAGCGSSRDRLRGTDGGDGGGATEIPIVASRGPSGSAALPSGTAGGPSGATAQPSASAAHLSAPPSSDAPGQSGPAASVTAPPAPTPTPAPVPVSGTLRLWTFAQGDDEVPIKAYLAEFKARNPDLDVKVNVIPEDNYTAKVNTALQAHQPPDIAIIEDMRWAKVGRVVRLNDALAQWGVPVEDFNPGGMGRMALEGDPAQGVYGIGDFLGGFVMVYNKQLFDEAGLPHPAVDRSMSFQEYDALCRALAKPADDPAQAVFGCSMGDNFYSLQGDDVFGADGRQITGNGDSDAMVNAFDIGTALIRDKVAPSGSTLDAIGGESDLFAQGKIAMTGTDFTEVPKYAANGIDFGIIPFPAVEGPEPVIDTFTAPWGTFTESSNPDAALAFLRFLATDAQRIRPQVSEDPPLRTSIAQELRYGEGDPIKEAYRAVLSHAHGGVFVPNGVEGWDPGEVVRKMTVEGKTDARPILDQMVADTQPELDRVWQEWEKLGQ